MTTCRFCDQPVRYHSIGVCRSDICHGKWNDARPARLAAAEADPRVKAIREDRFVGRGSCSSIDECYNHEELLAALVKARCETPDEAVAWARTTDGQYWESGLNQMFGDGGESDQTIRSCYEQSKLSIED